MKKFQKTLIAISLICASALCTTVLNGCGGNNQSEPNPTEVTIAETSTEPKTEAETKIETETETEAETETETEAPTQEQTETQADEDVPEPNTSEMVDYLVLKAKNDAETATDEDIQKAVDWLKNNTTNYFSGNENMENTMYYGELLEYKFEGTGNEYEKAGWQAFKTVKYVYRGVETIFDESTRKNLKELKQLVALL